MLEATYQFTVNPFTSDRGQEIKVHGQHGTGRLVSANEATGTVVVAWKGYSTALGSRTSLLGKVYCEAETAVYQLERVTAKGNRVFRQLVAWQTKSMKGGAR